MSFANSFGNKRILITGGTGSIGSGILRKVLQYNPEVVRIFSIDEDAQFNLQQELQSYPNVRFLIGDVKDKERLRMAVEGINIIFHAAALKHVPLCEYNPFEAVKTNVLGTQNVIEVAMDEEVEKVIAISTDKVVNPINVMGATKLLAERLTISVNYYKGARRTAFSCVRFGNVLDSRGSAVSLFREQIKEGGPITITDPDMTRFVMSVPRAVDLVLKAVEIAQGGEIFIFKMPALRIGDLVEAVVEELAPRYGYKPESIAVKTIGTRAGEKNHEQLMTNEEAGNAYEKEDMFVVMPGMSGRNQVRRGKIQTKSYASKSEPLLTKEEIRVLLKEIL